MIKEYFSGIYDGRNLKEASVQSYTALREPVWTTCNGIRSLVFASEVISRQEVCNVTIVKCKRFVICVFDHRHSTHATQVTQFQGQATKNVITQHYPKTNKLWTAASIRHALRRQRRDTRIKQTNYLSVTDGSNMLQNTIYHVRGATATIFWVRVSTLSSRGKAATADYIQILHYLHAWTHAVQVLP